MHKGLEGSGNELYVLQPGEELEAGGREGVNHNGARWEGGDP
jgi:hypothetical protein